MTTIDATENGAIPKINGSINVRDIMKNFFVENAKTSVVTVRIYNLNSLSLKLQPTPMYLYEMDHERACQS
jgi:hypothetical protein